MTLREKIEVMEAFERGEVIEYIPEYTNEWVETQTPEFDWRKCTYRIKPKPKQTVVIEKWLCSVVQDSLYVIEGTKEFMNGRLEKVKLLDTYEVEL